jgi:serine/threonine protein kinase
VGGWWQGANHAAGLSTSRDSGQAGITESPEAPLRLDDFEILETLGSGGMGDVYAARQRSLNRRVAIKFLRPEFSCNPERTLRFVQEAHAIAAIRHPGVVSIYGIGRDGEKLFLVIEFVDGASLEQLLEHGPLPVSEALRIADAIVESMIAVHRAGIVHRDLKPANVLIASDGQVRITDFGLAKMLRGDDLRLSLEGQVVGSPQYMAPEQISPAWGPVSERTDVYGFGSVLFAMLTGRAPVTGNDLGQMLLQIVAGEVQRRPLDLRPDVPAEVNSLCEHCLQADPERRPPSGEALRRALSECRTACPERSERTPSGLGNRTRRTAALAIAAVSLIALLATALGRLDIWNGDLSPNATSTVGTPTTALPESTADAAPDVRWEVEILRQFDPAQREWLTWETRPLRTGDALRLRAEFGQPSHAHMFWIGSDGSVQHLASTTDPTPQQHLAIPEDPGQALPVKSPDGLENCVVVYSRDPLADSTEWRSRLTPFANFGGPFKQSDYALMAIRGHLGFGESGAPDNTSPVSEDTELQKKLSHASRPVGSSRPIPDEDLQRLVSEYLRTVAEPSARIAVLVFLHQSD